MKEYDGERGLIWIRIHGKLLQTGIFRLRPKG